MLFDTESRLYYKQYDLEYDVRGNGDSVHKADRMKLDLFFDPFRRAAEQTELEVAVEMQRRSLQSILDAGGSVDDDESIKKNYNWYEVSYDKKDRKLLSFSLDEKKIENVKKTSGFFGYITLGLDYTAPLQTLDAYSLRDEQEKYLLSDEDPDGLRPSAQLVGGRKDGQAPHPLRRPDNKFIRAPYLEDDRAQETVRFNPGYP